MGEISMRAAKVMRELREERGISQEFIATAIGITRQAYSRYENGQREPNLDIINKICEVYNFSPVLLFFENYKDIESSHIRISGILAKYEETLRLINTKYREIKRLTIYKEDGTYFMVNEEEIYKDNNKTLKLKKEINDLYKSLPNIKNDFSKELKDLELDVEKKIEIINSLFIDGKIVKDKDIPMDFY
jgi:transcriptional regulator with XRE-family HTH domain